MSITVIIIVITVGLSIYSIERREMMDKLIFNPYVINIRNQWYRFITHGFIHADYTHLAVNMWVLYIFGRNVEYAYNINYYPMGTVAFILMYLSAIAIASISTFYKFKNNPGYNSLGASGATSAVIYASIMFNPFDKIGLIFIPMDLFSLPAIVFGILYLVYSSYMSKRGGGNINHDAHFYGAIFGFVYTLLLKPELGENLIRQIKNAIGI
jgi:membrane associated rhomboid family serine protease